MVGVGPVAADVDGADVALVPLWKHALTAVVYLPRIFLICIPGILQA